MEDGIYINRNDAIKQIRKFGVGSLDFEEGYTPEMAERFVIKLLRELPSEKTPTKHGKWLKASSGKTDHFICDNCKSIIKLPFETMTMPYRFCPCCGSDNYK